MSQKTPKTLLEFQERFATEEACERYLAEWRWPEGFRCPRCGGAEASRLSRRRLYQCCGCRHQTSITAGTAMHRSKLPLRTWFWAVFLVGRHKKGISALQLKSDLGLGSYRTAWLLLHKIRACFDESADYPLKGTVEVDETLIGAHMKGDPPGKDPGHKAIVAAAVEVKKGGMGSLRMAHVPDYTGSSLAGFVRRWVSPSAHLVTDGWRAYDQLEADGYSREKVISSHQPRGARHRVGMHSIHVVFSNLKTWLAGRFHGVTHKYLHAYLAEFAYRFNRRRSPPQLFGWVSRRLMARPACTLAQLVAEPSA
jgi:transposase-like protein